MNTDDRGFRSKLDALSRSLEARIHECKDRGEFSDTHEAFSEDIRKRRDSIKEKLDSAIDKRAAWELIKLELERDFNALNEVFSDWVKQLDAMATNKKK